MTPSNPESTPKTTRELGAGVWIWGAALLVAPLIIFRLPDEKRPESAPARVVSTGPAEPAVVRGRELARVVCATCHVFPPPDCASREQWAFEILPAKGKWLGLEPFDFEQHPGGEELKNSPVFPEQASVSPDEWSALRNFYLATAPAEGGVRTETVAKPGVMEMFDVLAVPANQQPRQTVVAIDEGLGVIYVGNENDSSVEVWSAEGQRITARAFHSAPSAIVVRPNSLMIGLIGNRDLSDETNGGLLRMAKPGSAGPLIQVVDDHLRRPVDIAVADFNGDGREDHVVAEQGGYLGLLSWLEDRGGSFQVHPLLERAGTRALAVTDLDGDQRSDIVAVTSHGYEAVEIFINRSNGFEPRTIGRKHPRWRFSDVEVADLNGDGRLDLVTVNGAKPRFQSDLEPIAADDGVSVWLADGQGGYDERRVRPLAGARRVAVADLDRDGDLDLAAIGYSNQPDANESLVFLLNDGAAHFTPRTIPEANDAHWSDIAAGDLDQDGDVDLVLVASHPGNNRAPLAILRRWAEKKIGLMILRNRGRP